MHYFTWIRNIGTILAILLFRQSVIAQTDPVVQYEIEFGEKYHAQIIQQMGLCKHTGSSKILNAVGERLIEYAPKNPYEFRFTVVDTQDPNAFAIPGGHLYATRGIIILFNSEDEMAGVFGHEMSHVLKRHSLKQMKKSVLPTLAQLPGAIVGIVDPKMGDAINAPIATLGKAYLANYSRGQESDADDLGIQIAGRSGYDPMALTTILDNLEKQVTLMMGKERKASWLDSHPTTAKREKDIEKKAGSIKRNEVPPISKDKYDFLKNFEGLIIGDDPDHGVFQGSKFLHPQIGITLQFPEDWIKENTPEVVGAADSTGQAVAVLSIAEKEPDSMAIYTRKALEQKYQIEPSLDESSSINGWSAHKLAFVIEDDKGKKVEYNYLWFATEDAYFQMAGAGYTEFHEPLIQFMKSLKKIKKEEVNSITYKTLKVVLAKEGENLGQLSERTSNVLPQDVTAVINGIEDDHQFKANDPVKIGISQRYSQK